MKIDYKIYKDKVYACWQGKNIGGTMGGPYEGQRTTHDVKGFATAAGEALPNDDLDLQLIWLQAMEHEGPKNITAEVLGEYWLSFIVPFWNEYGIGKRNMERGIMPPISGEFHNEWKHSNGAWIRTEIWATLAPACPDLAVRYAIEDAKVDHGMGEGTYAAAFVAAIESAAFVVSDVRKLIDIGLSKIPESSRMAKSVRLLLKCFDGGKTWLEARNAILNENADIGDGWFQAPSNVAYAMLGILYGGGDFKKSMITAINCGDDTDCTAATVGSVLGIMGGTKAIPEDWKNHIGDKIVTVSINRGISWRAINTCTDLTERVVRFAPVVLIENEAPVEICDKTEIPGDIAERFSAPYGTSEETDFMRRSTMSLYENTFTKRFLYATAFVTYKDGNDIAPCMKKSISLKLLNNVKAFGNIPYTVNVKVKLPEGFTADKTDFDVFLPCWTPTTKDCDTKPVEINITAGEKVGAVNRILLEISAVGRYTVGYIPVIFIVR